MMAGGLSEAAAWREDRRLSKDGDKHRDEIAKIVLKIPTKRITTPTASSTLR
jgi:hypothetical protein